MEKSTEYAKIGLRTLVFAKRNLSEEEYKEFEIEHNKEDNSKSLLIIENKMEFIGALHTCQRGLPRNFFTYVLENPFYIQILSSYLDRPERQVYL